MTKLTKEISDIEEEKHIWIVTIFPELFHSFLSYGVVASSLRGERGKKFKVHLLNLHDYSPFKYKNVDDRPYGGGPGMLMRADILKKALDAIILQRSGKKLFVILPRPQGEVFDQKVAKRLAEGEFSCLDSDLVFICGRYEGVDERFVEKYVDLELSLGDYVLSGAELAVMCILDSTLRFVKGTLGNEEGVENESFSLGLLEYPQYTRPMLFENLDVPHVLVSGNHKDIDEYKHSEALKITKSKRPDLYQKYYEKEDKSE